MRNTELASRAIPDQVLPPDEAPIPGPTGPRQDAAPTAGVAALLGAGALALLYGRVAALNLTTGVVGGDADGYQNLWNNYWVKTALLDLHTNPFYTTYIYYPTGTSLRFHTLNPFNGLLTIPFNLTLGYIPTTNLLFLASLTLTLWFSFFLIRDLVGDSGAAFAGAALFTYADPRVLVFFTKGQAEKLSAEWLPLYLIFLWRAMPPQRGAALPASAPRRWAGYAVLAVLTLIILSLTDWQYLMYAVLLTLLYFGVLLVTRPTRQERLQIFTRLAVIGGSYGAIVWFPLVLPMIQESLASPWLDLSYQSQAHALDLLDILGPGQGNPGYLAWGLALLGLAVTLRQGGPAREWGIFWAAVAGGFYLLALGPELTIGGQGTGLPLPYAAFQDLPVLRVGRDPGRFSTVAVLGIAVLAAFGLHGLLGRLRGWPARLSRGGRTLLTAAGLALVLVLTLGGFMADAGAATVSPPQWPAFYRQIAQDPASYAIFELPAFTDRGLGENHYMMYQVLHGKPRFSGRLARDHGLSNPNNFIKQAGLFRHLWLLSASPSYRAALYPEQDFLQRTDYATQGTAILNHYHVRYIVLYEDALGPDWDEAEFQRVIGQVLGPGVQPTYQDAQTRVYAVPTVPPPSNPLTLDLGDGWDAPEATQEGRSFRWADPTQEQATLYTMNLAAQPVQANLRVAIVAYEQARTIHIALNGTEVGTIRRTPEEGAKVDTIELTIPPGEQVNTIAFSSPEPARPDHPPAQRLLSFSLYDATLEVR